MSERILKALMQMFAIIARVDGINDNGRLIVQSFLKQQLNQELVDQYLAIFDEFLEAHHAVTKKKDGTAKRTSLNSVKVLRICTQINSELTQVQKVVVLIRLIEFINSNEDIAEQELEFVKTVAETFNISEEEFNSSMDFVRASIDNVPDSSRVLLIDNHPKHNLKETKHIFAEGVTGQARVLWIQSVNLYALLYFGKSDLYLNGQILNSGKVFILTPGSSLRSSKVKPVYYSDILSAFMSDTSKAKVSFAVQDLEYKFKGGKLGLRDINFNEDSGKLIAVKSSKRRAMLVLGDTELTPCITLGISFVLSTRAFQNIALDCCVNCECGPAADVSGFTPDRFLLSRTVEGYFMIPERVGLFPDQLKITLFSRYLVAQSKQSSFRFNQTIRNK